MTLKVRITPSETTRSIQHWSKSYFSVCFASFCKILMQKWWNPLLPDAPLNRLKLSFTFCVSGQRILSACFPELAWAVWYRRFLLLEVADETGKTDRFARTKRIPVLLFTRSGKTTLTFKFWQSNTGCPKFRK